MATVMGDRFGQDVQVSGGGGGRRIRLALAIAAVIVAPFVAGCSLQLRASLFAPLNREVSGTGEAALVARARHLLLGGLAEAVVAQNLVSQGQTEDEARRIVALAVAAQKGK